MSKIVLTRSQIELAKPDSQFVTYDNYNKLAVEYDVLKEKYESLETLSGGQRA